LGIKTSERMKRSDIVDVVDEREVAKDESLSENGSEIALLSIRRRGSLLFYLFLSLFLCSLSPSRSFSSLTHSLSRVPSSPFVSFILLYR
jgi:hypothetical protein